MHIEKKTLRKVFVGVIVCIVLYWILHESERAKAIVGTVTSVFAPFAVGAAIAFVLNVPMRWFEGLLSGVKNAFFRRVIAVVLTLVCVLLVLTAVFLMLIPELIEAVTKLIPSVTQFFIKTGDFFYDLIKNNEALIQWGTEKANLESFNWANLVERVMGVVGTSVESIIYRLFDTVSSVLGGVFDAFIAIVFSIYCLFQKETLARQSRKILYAFLPEKVADTTIEIATLSSDTFSNFLSGQCIEVCILGSLFAITMAIFRMPYVALISVLIAVTAFVPIVGAWIGCVFGAFFIFVENYVTGGSGMQAVWFFVLFVVLQQIENNLIYPHVVGSSIGLSGMWVLLAVGVGGELLGVGGMLIMIPITSVIYTIIRNLTNHRLGKGCVDPEKLVPLPPTTRKKFIHKVLKKKKEKAETPSESSEN